ncbi:MAG: hypothetical protein KGQ59_01215 [Bdellovibrionales bacterium]|nr:hypothetical protein [Bdellovibrionales bacterium]
MTLLILVMAIALSPETLAGTPPRGKSLGTSYEITDQPLGIFDIQGRIERRSLQLEAKSEDKKEVKTKKKSFAKIDSIKITRSAPLYETSNLPTYHRGIDRSNVKASDRVVYVPQNASVRLGGVRTGDIFRAVVDQEIKASPSVPTPIRAMVTSGTLKGGFFVGEATLDRELKRVLLTFTKVRTTAGKIYNVRASGLSKAGTIGLEGEYHSQAGKFFVAELASATAAGFLDATINRSQNAFGTYSQEPSLQNSAKAGVVTALSKSADRFAEQSRQAPEYTSVDGYQTVQIIVQDEPTEVN